VHKGSWFGIPVSTRKAPAEPKAYAASKKEPFGGFDYVSRNQPERHVDYFCWRPLQSSSRTPSRPWSSNWTHVDDGRRSRSARNGRTLKAYFERLLQLAPSVANSRSARSWAKLDLRPSIAAVNIGSRREQA